MSSVSAPGHGPRPVLHASSAVAAARRPVAAVAVLFLAAVTPAEGQSVSGWLPPEHWSGALLTRLHALGEASRDPAVRHRPAGEAAALLPAPYRAWLSDEWPLLAGGARMTLVAGGGLAARRGAVAPGGFTLDREWRAGAKRDDRTAPAASLRWGLQAGQRLGLTAEVRSTGDVVELEHGTVDVVIGRFELWAGRRRLGFQPSSGGGLVLHEVRLDGAGARLVGSGRVSGEAFGGPLARNGHVDSPWLAGLRLHVSAHPRLDIGGTRVAVFGGMGGARLGVRQLGEVAVGLNLSDEYADDQVGSVDARWRPPLGVPIELYGEWGIHDADPLVAIDVPAFSAGARIPRLPAAAAVGVVLEHTRISGACCRNPPWYHHFELADLWTSRGALLGHPLGGQGWEWRLGVTAAPVTRALLVDVTAAARRRGPENLFAPARQGRSAQFRLNADARLAARTGAVLRLDLEQARGWREVHALLELRRRL